MDTERRIVVCHPCPSVSIRGSHSAAAAPRWAFAVIRQPVLGGRVLTPPRAQTVRSSVGVLRENSGVRGLWLVVCFDSPLHMLGAFSKLFRKSEPAPAPARPTGPQHPSRGAAPVSTDGTLPRPNVPRPLPTRLPATDCLSIPYSSIIKLIPQELWGKLAPAGLA